MHEIFYVKMTERLLWDSFKFTNVSQSWTLCPQCYWYIAFFFFRATPVAFGSSQARCQNGAAAASLHHSHRQQCWIWAASVTYITAHQQRWILNPLSKARDQTPILMDTNWLRSLLNHNRNSWYALDGKWLCPDHWSSKGKIKLIFLSHWCIIAC